MLTTLYPLHFCLDFDGIINKIILIKCPMLKCARIPSHTAKITYRRQHLCNIYFCTPVLFNGMPSAVSTNMKVLLQMRLIKLSWLYSLMVSNKNDDDLQKDQGARCKHPVCSTSRKNRAVQKFKFKPMRSPVYYFRLQKIIKWN